MLEDNLSGVPYSVSHAGQVAGLESAVDAYLASRPETMSLLDALLKEDPDLLMALCFRGYLLKLAGHPQFEKPIAACLRRAQDLVASGSCNTRERMHVQALALWCNDQNGAAIDVLEQVLSNHPTDMLALRIAHYLHFYSGVDQAMLQSTERVLPHWSQENPQYGFFLGMHAFGCEEAGKYEHALEFGQAAVALNPADLWATHAVTHVFQMRDEHQQGVDWLQGLAGHWGATNNFRYHVIWHQALHFLGLGDNLAALDIYDSQLAASIQDDFYLDVCNNAALLLRLEFLGVDVGARWQAMADICAHHVDDRELLFANLHYLLPLVKTKATGVDKVVANLEDWACAQGDQAHACAQVGVALAQAIVSAESDPEKTATQLIELQQQRFLIGGSHAQRDVFRLLAADSAQRAERLDLLAQVA